MSTVKFDTWQNTDGTENYKVRAWVNFDPDTSNAIRASGNVSTITDNGVGDYTVNFTTALPDTNYGFAICGGNGASATTNGRTYNQNGAAPTTTAFRFTVKQENNTIDDNTACVAIFR